MKSSTTLTRPINPMPKYVRDALTKARLFSAYKSRPPYQQNDYIGWINRAKLESTKQKRLNQMIDELRRGDSYMKMKWSGR